MIQEAILVLVGSKPVHRYGFMDLRLEGYSDRVRSVTFSPDGRHIISGSDDKTVRIWNVETGFAVGKPLEGHTDYVQLVAY